MLDFDHDDPHRGELIAAHGGAVAPPTRDLAREQVRIYGLARYEQLTRLSNAMAHVRNAYTEALAQAQQRGTGPGWSQREVAPQYVTQHDPRNGIWLREGPQNPPRTASSAAV